MSLVLRRFHFGLCSRLAEVLRRREQLVALASPSTAAGPGASAAPGSFQSSVRHLTVAELRAAEARSSTAKPAPSGKVAKTKAQLRADTREVVASLAHWVKTHPFLQAVTLDKGEASVGLLLLWEAEHKRIY